MRKIIDSKTEEVTHLTQTQRARLERRLDRLGVAKDASVQININNLDEGEED